MVHTMYTVMKDLLVSCPKCVAEVENNLFLSILSLTWALIPRSGVL